MKMSLVNRCCMTLGARQEALQSMVPWWGPVDGTMVLKLLDISNPATIVISRNTKQHWEIQDGTYLDFIAIYYFPRNYTYAGIKISNSC